MKSIDFGQKTDFEQNNNLVSLKSKGEKITLRLLGSPHYDAKHFLKEGDDWNVINCPRIMDNEECNECEKFFEASKALKDLKDAGIKDGPEVKTLEKEKEKNKATISFYYPVINRDTEKFVIFKTTTMVRVDIDKEFNNGIDVLKYDYVIERTEVPGKYYAFTRLPEANIEPLSEQEEEEIKRYEALSDEDIVNIIGGKKKKSSHDLTKDDEESHVG